jgi:ABC-type transport system involved in multi-copper enzyme maturation permease subunit
MFDMDLSLLAQQEAITNWLTPVWLLSLGVAVGFVVVMLFVGKIFLFSKLPFVAKIAESRGLRIGLGIVSAAVMIAAFLYFYYWTYGASRKTNFAFTDLNFGDLILPLAFVIPFALFIGIGSWTLFTKRGSDEALALMREGFLSWMSIVCMALTGFAIIGIVLGIFNGFGVIKFVDDVPGMVKSIKRYPMSGVYGPTLTVPPTKGTDVGTLVPAGIQAEEISFVSVRSDQQVEVASEPIRIQLAKNRVLEASATSTDEPVTRRRQPGTRSWIPDGPVENFYIANRGTRDANVTLHWRIDPIYRQVWVVPWTAFCVLMIYVLYLVFAVNFPKIAAISLSTFKTEVSQPLFWLILVIGVVFVIGSVYVPYNTFGEDIKMYKDSGLTLIRVLAIFMAIWAASKSVAEEIEGRTALTVLSKPVGRRQFILGKFSGISLAVGMLFILLGLAFVIFVAYKPIYDAVETSKGSVEWQLCFLESILIIPAVFLSFLEVVIFVAISVAISTRLGILANFLICFAIYVLGHLTPLIVQSSEVVQAFQPVVVFGNVVAVIFPVLNHFDVQAAINTNSVVPMEYMGWSTIYCMLYGAIALLLALVLFEDRDLA